MTRLRALLVAVWAVTGSVVWGWFDIRDAHVYGGAIAVAAAAWSFSGYWEAGAALLGVFLVYLGLRSVGSQPEGRRARRS